MPGYGSGNNDAFTWPKYEMPWSCSKQRQHRRATLFLGRNSRYPFYGDSQNRPTLLHYYEEILRPLGSGMMRIPQPKNSMRLTRLLATCRSPQLAGRKRTARIVVRRRSKSFVLDLDTRQCIFSEERGRYWYFDATHAAKAIKPASRP